MTLQVPSTGGVVVHLNASSGYGRNCHPRETVARLRPRFAEFGISRLARITGLDDLGIPVWAAIRPNSLTLASAQGKGIDDDAAAASAVMEAVEVACAEAINIPSRIGSAASLRAGGMLALTLDSLIHKTSTPLGDDETFWVEGFDASRQQPIWIPREAAGVNGSIEVRRFWQSTDGLASGNTLDEAIAHGLCERIERDAITLWRLRSDAYVASRCIDPAGLRDADINRLIAKVNEAGLRLRLFDITSDVGIPVCFAAISSHLDGGEAEWTYFDLSTGSGCHPSLARAALRAITEAAQTRLTTIAASRDDFNPALYARKINPDLLVYVKAEPPPAKEASLPFSPLHASDPRSNIDHMLERLAAVGIDRVVVVSLTPADETFAVAKVVVPELETITGARRVPFGRRAFRAMKERQ